MSHKQRPFRQSAIGFLRDITFCSPSPQPSLGTVVYCPQATWVVVDACNNTVFFALHALTHALQVSSVDPGDSGKELGTLTTQSGDRRHHVPFVNGNLEYRKEKQSYSWNPSGLWKTSWRVGQELPANDPPSAPPPSLLYTYSSASVGKEQREEKG